MATTWLAPLSVAETVSYQGDYQSEIRFSGHGDTTTQSVLIPEGAFRYEFRHKTDAQSALLIVSVQVDTNQDGEFCGDLDSGCGLMFNAANQSIMNLTRRDEFARLFYGGMTRFSIQAPGDWQLSIHPHPFPRQALRVDIRHRPGGTFIDDAAVTIRNARGESFPSTTDAVGRFVARIYRDSKVRISARGDAHLAASTEVPLAALRDHEPSRPLVVELQLQVQPVTILVGEPIRLAGLESHTRRINVQDPIRLQGFSVTRSIDVRDPLRLQGIITETRTVEVSEPLRLKGFEGVAASTKEDD